MLYDTSSLMKWSLSARRAWIEIFGRLHMTQLTTVALRKESVDRNGLVDLIHIHALVALRKESVDRNGYKCSII